MSSSFLRKIEKYIRHWHKGNVEFDCVYYPEYTIKLSRNLDEARKLFSKDFDTSCIEYWRRFPGASISFAIQDHNDEEMLLCRTASIVVEIQKVFGKYSNVKIDHFLSGTGYYSADIEVVPPDEYVEKDQFCPIQILKKHRCLYSGDYKGIRTFTSYFLYIYGKKYKRGVEIVEKGVVYTYSKDWSEMTLRDVY